jgi:hypothetical protein
MKKYNESSLAKFQKESEKCKCGGIIGADGVRWGCRCTDRIKLKPKLNLPKNE